MRFRESFTALCLENETIHSYSSIHHSWVDYEPTKRPAYGWLVLSVGRSLQRYRRGHGFDLRRSLNFFQVLFSHILPLGLIAKKLQVMRIDEGGVVVEIQDYCSLFGSVLGTSHLKITIVIRVISTLLRSDS